MPEEINQKGQSLVELLIAMGIFVLLITSIVTLILDVYMSDRVGREKMVATFLAKEGIEATTSIRDNNWDDLTNGDHGISISGGNFVFQGTQEDVSDYLKEGQRTITIEGIDSDRKRITSKVTWTLTEIRSQEINLITYLTNWRKGAPPQEYCEGTPDACDTFLDQTSCEGQEVCSWTPGACGGTCTPCGSFGNQTECNQQSGCSWFFIWCTGTCTSCDSFGDQSSCQGQSGCSWTPGTCSGSVTPCDNYTTQESCENQNGCSWVQ